MRGRPINRTLRGLDNQLLPRSPPPVSLAADVQRRERLGGLLNLLPPGGRMSGRPIKRTLRGRKNVIEGIFDTLKAVQSGLTVKAG